MADPAASLLEVVQVYASAAGPVQALRGVSLDISPHAITGIVGPSGAGKSTLLRLLACLEDPTAGEVTIAGTVPARLGPAQRRRFVATHIGYVFQTPGDNVIDYLSVEDHVRLSRGVAQSPTELGDLFEQAGLLGAMRLPARDLSAGEQQILAFAAAASGSPTLLLADEPTAELDPSGRDRLIELLGSLAALGATIVVSTHDEVLLSRCDDILLIRNGVLAATGSDPAQLDAVIDSAGRIALPADAAEVLPERRARVSRSGDDGYRIERP